MRLRKTDLLRSLPVALAAGGLVLALGGCKKEEPPPPPPPKAPPPPPPPPPEPVDLGDVASSLDVDPRVTFEQEFAPTDRSLAEALFTFASALAQKDAEQLGEFFDARTREVLAMVASEWYESEIEDVRVVLMSEGGGGVTRGAPASGGSVTAEDVMALVRESFDAAGDQFPQEMRQFMEAMLQAGGAQQLADQLNALSPEQVEQMLAEQQRELENMNDQQVAMAAQMLNMSPDEYRSQMREMMEVQTRQLRSLVAAPDEGERDDANISDASATVAMAVQDQQDAFVLLWDAQRFDDGWYFRPLPATSATRPTTREWAGLSLGEYQAAPLALERDVFEIDFGTPQEGDGTPGLGGGGGGGSAGG